jgi:hypothetical protein
MDMDYPATLTTEYCIMEVWDACGGNVQEVYQKIAPESIMKCYKSLCPSIVTMQQL